jgi:hypothetical protein
MQFISLLWGTTTTTAAAAAAATIIATTNAGIAEVATAKVRAEVAILLEAVLTAL